ncbi:MAG: hypothetical protein Q8S10_08375 [Thiobacillus sp.]|nr:hypothetical protein [Thiobacillus sp.]
MTHPHPALSRALRAVLLTALLALAASTVESAPHPDACIEGYVWREAFPDDRICVTPDVREQTARDNRLAHTRRLMSPAAANGTGYSREYGEFEAARPSAPAAQAPATIKKKMATKKMAAKKASFKLPEFPWPPPPYSTRLRLDRALLVAAQPTPSNGSVAARMEQALAANGYNEVSYYAVPDGFAMVTQIERIDPDAAPAAEQRWSTQIDPVSLIPFSLDAYLKALFGKDGDTFRVIVFTFTPTPFTTGARPVPPGVAMAWVEQGATALPAALAILPYGEDTVCTALVYEFTLTRLGGMLQRPSSFNGMQHLRAAGILGTLEQQR